MGLFYYLSLTIVAIIVLSTDTVTGKAYQNSTSYNRGLVRNQIFGDYDTSDNPDNLTVHVGVALISFDLHPELNRMDAYVWMRLVWFDSRLKWDEEKYNVSVLRVPAHEVWKPDVVLYNSYAADHYKACAQSHVLVYPTGEVLWVPPCNYQAVCDMKDIRNNPKGKQSCHLKFGSWVYDGFALQLKLYKDKPEVDITDMWDITNWKLTGQNATEEVKFYPCCEEPYGSLYFNMEFEKKVGADRITSAAGEFHAIQSSIMIPLTWILFWCFNLS
jgi:hypothetical protein